MDCCYFPSSHGTWDFCIAQLSLESGPNLPKMHRVSFQSQTVSKICDRQKQWPLKSVGKRQKPPPRGFWNWDDCHHHAFHAWCCLNIPDLYSMQKTSFLFMLQWVPGWKHNNKAHIFKPHLRVWRPYIVQITGLLLRSGVSFESISLVFTTPLIAVVMMMFINKQYETWKLMHFQTRSCILMKLFCQRKQELRKKTSGNEHE